MPCRTKFALNSVQRKELAKVFLDSGKAIFLGSVASYFIPILAEIGEEVTFGVAARGLLGSLTSIFIGVILLKEVKQ